MTLISFDIIVSILQSLIFSYTIIYCVENKEEINRIKLFSMLAVLVIICLPLFGCYGSDSGITIFLTHILAICSVILFYNKNIRESLTAYTIIYCVLGIYNVIFGNLIFESISEIIPIKYINYEKVCIMYIPQFIIILLCFKYINKIKQIYKLILIEKFSMSILIISFIMDFILTFYLLKLGEKSQLVKNIIDIAFFMVLVVIIIYFGKVHQKSEQIFKLNESLEVKNNELRKIKHDYGAQISYLYGLCLMERFDDLKKSLKDIINTNENTQSAVEINENDNSLLSLALRPALENGIHVIIKGDSDISLCKMPEMELYRVISNIVNNAIKAMDGKGIIIAKLYEQMNSLVIKIENNGPKIEEENLKKIFKPGFTTKNNKNQNHGFGLSIVKDLIENYNGSISLRSSDISTEFKISLPIKEI